MPEAVSNTSPLLYLYRIGRIEVLAQIFGAVWTVPAVVAELAEGQKQGYEVPNSAEYGWLRVKSPQSVPSEWLARDLGRGEIEAIALALEQPGSIVILDDALARRIAQAAGLEVWGTLRVPLEAKKRKFVPAIAPIVDELRTSGMWISEDVRRRILALSGEQFQVQGK